MLERIYNDWGLIIIVMVVALLILIILNTIYIYLPIHRIERKVNHVVNNVEGAVPVVNKAIQDVIGLVDRSLTLENNIGNFIESLGCVICRFFTSAESREPSFCQGVRLRPVHQVCPPLTPLFPPSS